MLGDDVRMATPFFRQQAESMMTDECVVTRAGGAPVLDPVTLLVTPGTPATLYAGRVWLRQPTAQELDTLFGEEQVTRTRYVAVLPWNTYGIHIGDVLTMTAADDPDTLDRSYSIVAIPASTYTVSKPFPCEVVS